MHYVLSTCVVARKLSGIGLQPRLGELCVVAALWRDLRMAFEGRTYMMASDLSEQFLRRPYCTSHLPKILQSTANATSVYPTCPEGAPIPNSRIHFLKRPRKPRSFGRIPASQAEMEGPVHRSGPRRCEGEIVKVIQCRNSPLARSAGARGRQSRFASSGR